MQFNNKKKKNKNDVSSTGFDREKFILRLLIVFAIFIAILLPIKIVNNISDVTSFHSISKKPNKVISDKQESLNNAYERIREIVDNNDALSATNLTLAKVYTEVIDDEDKRYFAENAPVPILNDEDMGKYEENDKSAAFQIFEKLQNRYKTFNQSLYNLCGTNPVNIVRQYHYDGYSIIGKYNPEEPSHVKGKRHTWFIKNFQNVNIFYQDGDGNYIDDVDNIKDIMSMASVYTYYRDPYDVRTFLKYCYDLFDSSYTYVASISEVYYCSGCMSYDEVDVATDSLASPNITYDKIKLNTETQKVLPKDIPYKAGYLHRTEDYHEVTPGDYSSYVNGILNGELKSGLNYCPGHIDLNLYVTVLTLDDSNGLTSIDKNYGNKGFNYTKNWHGWDALTINKARQLSYKDWDAEYGIGISYVDFVNPLTQEEINYYLSRLGDDISENRKAVVETALRSVGRIPYYYGGKTSRFGYDGNSFGSKIPADYKGRCLKGLDCSGWVNWVYGTTFNKYIIKSEGTAKLATEGTKILRSDLLPGDIIVRPGIDSHVMMFLDWAPNGQVTVIHENGGVNNVSIGTFDAYYPYYRRIINS